MRQLQRLPILLRALRKLNFPRKLGLLERIYGAHLSHYGVCWVACANGVHWKLDLADSCHRWIVFGKYEGGYGIDFAASELSQGGVYVDSGANIGQWLLYLAHLPNIKILAFEPVSSERAWLTECISKQSQWHVDVFDHGLGSEDSELEIQVHGARSTLNMDWYQDENFSRETVAIRKLDDVLERLHINTVDFWKLDTEGAEFHALKGAKKHLQNRKIKIVYFECHPSNYVDIVEFFNSVNYGVFDLVGGELIRKSDATIPKTRDLIAKPL